MSMNYKISLAFIRMDFPCRWIQREFCDLQTNKWFVVYRHIFN